MDKIVYLMQYFDWIGYGILLLGTKFIGDRKQYGWLVCATGSLCVIFFGIVIHKYGLVFWNVIFMIIYLLGYKNDKAFIGE